MPEIGVEAPEFKLLDRDGWVVELRAFRGRRVCLFLSPGIHLYGPGTIHKVLGALSDSENSGLADAVVIAVNADSTKHQQRFAERHGLAYLFLSDPEHVVAMAYEVWQHRPKRGRPFHDVVPSVFLIDDQGHLTHAWYDVKVQTFHDSFVAAVGRDDSGSADGSHDDGSVVTTEPEAI